MLRITSKPEIDTWYKRHFGPHLGPRPQLPQAYIRPWNKWQLVIKEIVTQRKRETDTKIYMWCTHQKFKLQTHNRNWHGQFIRIDHDSMRRCVLVQLQEKITIYLLQLKRIKCGQFLVQHLLIRPSASSLAIPRLFFFPRAGRWDHAPAMPSSSLPMAHTPLLSPCSHGSPRAHPCRRRTLPTPPPFHR
jgi:hypothetical protein